MKITPLDKLFSEYVRRKAIKKVGGCERCLTAKYDTERDDSSVFPAWMHLQCSHYWGRGCKSVRYDEANAVGLCGACHMYFAAHPPEHEAFYKKRLGQARYDMLEIRARMPAQHLDIKAITLFLQAKIKEMEV